MLNSALEMWLYCFECIKEEKTPVKHLYTVLVDKLFICQPNFDCFSIKIQLISVYNIPWLILLEVEKFIDSIIINNR